MTFDATISLGNLIQIVLMIVAALAAFFTLRGQVKIMEEKMRSEREQRLTIAARVDKLENQIENDFEKLRIALDEGLRRIYDRLERKADK